MPVDVTAEFGKLFALLFMMMGPVAVMPVFAMITAGASGELSRKIALRAAFFAALAVTVAVQAGYGALVQWGASPDSLIIAAGLLLLLSSLGHALASAETPKSAPETGERVPPPALAVALSPLAFPLMASPPAIGVLVIFSAYFRSTGHQLAILGIGLTLVALDLLAMMVARPVLRTIGIVPLRIAGAVFGVLQVALAVEFIVSGIARSGLLR